MIKVNRMQLEKMLKLNKFSVVLIDSNWNNAGKLLIKRMAFNLITIFFLSMNTMAAEVEVYDFVKNEVYLVSEDKLGPEMMRVSLDGKIYWANANQLTQNTYQHPPFEGELKQRIINIQKELEAVNAQGYAEWEDGFRRDQNPANEIAIWERIVGVYRMFSKNYQDISVKREIYRIAVMCSYSEPSVVLNQVNNQLVSVEVVQEIIAEYYR